MRRWLDEVGKRFQEVGKGVRAAADEVRKTAGVGVGTIGLKVGASHYKPGESITGLLTLTLEEPTPAKRLVVRLVATRQRVRFELRPNGKREKVLSHEVEYEFDCELSGERTYTNGEYPFAIHVPTTIDAKSKAGGVIGDVVRAVQSLDELRRTPLRWRLVGFLDVPWKRNVKKKLDVSIASPDE